MRSDYTALLVAVSASGALAAPVQACGPHKTTFAVPVKPVQEPVRDPKADLLRAAHKYGFDIPFINPSDPIGSLVNCTAFLNATIPSYGSGSNYTVLQPLPGTGSKSSSLALSSSTLVGSVASTATFSSSFSAIVTATTTTDAAGNTTLTATASASATGTVSLTASGVSTSTDTASTTSTSSTSTDSASATSTSSASTDSASAASTSSASTTDTASSTSTSTSTSSASASATNTSSTTTTLSETSTSSTTTSAASTSTAATGQTGEVGTTPEENESSYLSPVSIGGQSLNLNFDTGSADLWVFSTRLSPDQINGHTAFNPNQSTTWSELPGASWQIRYGDGSTAQGSVGYDRVQIGSVAVNRQAVELAEQVSPSFVKDANNDGLLGLAFSSINTVSPVKQKTWFENVKPQLQQPVFTADLEEDASGTYEFGAVNPAKYTGDIHYTNIDTSRGFWQFQSPTFRVGGKAYKCQTCSNTIADTGTSLLLMDSDVVSTYWAQVQGAATSQYYGGYIYPCNSALPDLDIAIGPDFVATVPGKAMEYASIGDGKCFGSLQTNYGAGIQILGIVLFKNYFAIFDGTNGAERLGLAAKSP